MWNFNSVATFFVIGIAFFILDHSFVLNLEILRDKYVDHKYGMDYLKSLKIGQIIIDTDIGSDDAVAIAYALQTPDHTKQVFSNNMHPWKYKFNQRTKLHIKIPVFAGMERSILVTPPGNNFYGIDGLRDFDYPDPLPMSKIEKEHAVFALIRLVKENPGEITLIAIGPLSNVAMAIRLDPSFRLNLKQLFVLGGSVDGYGNLDAGMEFNFLKDAEANFIVFNATDHEVTPVILFPWDTHVNSAHLEMEWKRNVLGTIQTPLIDFLNKAEAIEKSKMEFWHSSDTSVMVTVFNPEWVQATEYVHVVPVTSGEFRGGLIIDRSNVRNRYKNAIIIRNADKEMYRTLILNTFK